MLEGSVQRFGDRVPITAQLIEAATDKLLWAKARALSGDFFWTVATQAAAYANLGKTDEARKIIEELHERVDEEHVSLAAFAILYAALGDKEQALDWLEKEYEERTGDALLYLKIAPYWDSLRSEPRFIALLKKMGLDE